MSIGFLNKSANKIHLLKYDSTEAKVQTCTSLCNLRVLGQVSMHRINHL